MDTDHKTDECLQLSVQPLRDRARPWETVWLSAAKGLSTRSKWAFTAYKIQQGYQRRYPGRYRVYIGEMDEKRRIEDQDTGGGEEGERRRSAEVMPSPGNRLCLVMSGDIRQTVESPHTG